jgi:hypothetical protein
MRLAAIFGTPISVLSKRKFMNDRVVQTFYQDASKLVTTIAGLYIPSGNQNK